ncbi:MAG TPA: RNA polymerase sigma factor [Thermoanaerobaculia bacterium]|jgi:RNA polymerase sigma-70 factor (ECF subfamily)
MATADETLAISDPERRALAALDRADPRAALAVLMEAYGTPLYRFCRQLVGDDALAEDVLQMTFVQAHDGLPRFARRSSLSTWLFGIARHRCLDALKAARRRRARFQLVADPPEAPDGGAAADERLAARSLRGALRRCLDKLAPAVRTAVLLRFQEDLSYPEMALVCGARPPALQARVARALPALRRCLESEGVRP